MKNFQVRYEMLVGGHIDVQAESEDDARKTVERMTLIRLINGRSTVAEFWSDVKAQEIEEVKQLERKRP